MPVTEPPRAVFLSYASQDAETAQRICDALRAGGIEVWFDQSELRGGDVWDQSIRKQIKTCALFLPIVSRNTHARGEGYFRLEWKLAIDRSHLIASDLPFLLPVVIDDTPDTDDRVPERFREIQWTHLPGGATSPAFIERVKRLLSAEASALELARSPSSAAASSAASQRKLTRRRPGVFYSALAAAVLLALGYFGLERLNRSKPIAPAAGSIAVLPLANESGETGQQYFSDGISEDLITALAQFPGLKVIGRTSSFQFRDSKEDSRSIGAKLGVAHLLEGSVRKSGDMIRVSAELIDTADGSMKWSERYDRAYKDLFALQDEITHAVASALRTKLLPDEHAVAQSDRPAGGSLEAYNALLQGKFYLLRWNSEADLRNAIEYFTHATDIDPSYALAWSELSRAWVFLSANFLQDAPEQQQQAQAKARETVNRALALSPELAAAHVARGLLFQVVDFDWRAGEAEFRRAVALAPNNVEAKGSFAFALATLGELGPAVDLIRQVLATEPLRANGYGSLAMFLSGLNRVDEAEQAIRRAIELQPGATSHYVWLTHIQIQRGNAQAALAAAQQSDPDERPTEVTLAQQIGIDRNAADAALRTFIAKYGEHSDSAYDLAQIYALRNDANATFEWLDRAWSNRDPGITYTLFDPFILRFKDDPRFAAFCRKVGLPVPGEAPAHKSI
jgi:TolB-like protein/Tfp pilus assembly protein PilF